MNTFKRDRTSRLRAIRAYLVMILACTFLLFCVSLINLNEQREKVSQLSSSNLKLITEHTVRDIEYRMEHLAADCLGKGIIEGLNYDFDQKDSLDQLRQMRKQFHLLTKSYPIARHFFVSEGDRLIFPLLQTPRPQDLGGFVSSNPDRNYHLFSEILKEGDTKGSLGYAHRAAEAYRAAEKIQVNSRLKALAVHRCGGVLRQTGEHAESIQTYRRLLTTYGDQYGESQAPYILCLAAEPELEKELFSFGSLNEVYQNLVNGKWELSAEQTSEYLTYLEKRLAIPPGGRRSSEFLEHFELAKALGRELSNQRSLTPSAVTQRSFEYGGKPYQIYSTALRRKDGRTLVLGFSVSIPWVENSLLAGLTGYIPHYLSPKISLVEASRSQDAAENDVYVPFSRTLPLWKIRLSIEAMRLNEMAASKEVWFVGLSAFMFLSILGLGLFLLIHVSWDIRSFQLRSDFVSGVTHEFKTPLSLIRLYSETLADDDQEFSPKDRKNYIQIIARESERMSRLINNVLDFSKMEQGQRQHELQQGDLTDAVTQTVEDYSEYLARRGFELQFSVQPGLPPVNLNREQISQMLLNLMDNAEKYSGKSRKIRVNVWAQNQEVIIEVADHGLGIPAEEIYKIFQPFYRVSRGGEKGGCGLGLYLVDQVMKQHGGRVEVESAVNSGSRFRLIFPAGDSGQVRRARKGGITAARLAKKLRARDA